MFHCSGCVINQSKTLQRGTLTCYVHGFSGSGIRTEHRRTPHLCPSVLEASTGSQKDLLSKSEFQVAFLVSAEGLSRTE